MVTRTPPNITFKPTSPKTETHNVKPELCRIWLITVVVMKRILSHMLINTQREAIRNPSFTTPPSINSITLNKFDTSITRSRFGAAENGINVKNCVDRRSPDFRFFIAKFTCGVRKSESASSDTSLPLSNAHGGIWMNWHSCEISDIRGGHWRRPSLF